MSAHEPTQARRRYDSPLRRQRAAETRERIVAAGAELLHGFPVWNWRALTIRSVAARAGVNERTVYRHFANERDLRDAVMARLESEAGVALEGLALGGLSSVLEMTYPGIAMQSVALTFATLAVMLVAYRSGVIKATEKFKLGVVAATGAIALYYVIGFVLSFFGVAMPFLQGNSTASIVVSGVIVVVAALNLILDFDFIETGVQGGAPKYLEWYGAFGLMVTLVWLYLEILRLLAKARSRR